jgi:nicotinate-nucleotide adenylyltransferase
VPTRVAIFGGSFNPPHVGHVLACALLLSVEEIDRVLVIPTFVHPFAKILEPFADRLRMCELAMGWIPNVDVSPVEAEMGGSSLTLHTLEHLGRAHPDWQLRLVVGSDILTEAHRWFGFDAIERLAPPLILPRAGMSEGAPESSLLPNVSSTQVRAAIARGEWIALQRIVPRTVLEYVRSRALYGASA